MPFRQIRAVLAFVLLLASAFAQAPAPAPARPDSTHHHTYANKDGKRVRSPERSVYGGPAGSTAQCRDGSYSFSQHRSGTCSHHGGVASWINGK